MNTVRRLLLALLFVLVATALADAGDDQAYELPGVIAYVGADYNVYTFNLHAGLTTAHTTDARPDRRYIWPTWSYNEDLAYFCCDVNTSGQPFTQVYISPDGVSAGSLAHVAQDALFNYASWSPRNCTTDSDCRDLAVLFSVLGESQLSVDLIRRTAQPRVDVRRIGQGAPFYYSWSPTGAQILTHRNVNNLDVFDVESGEFTDLQYRAGLFPAPQWSPVDDRLLVGVRTPQQTTDLAIIANDNLQVLRQGLTGEVAFNWSPNGDYIAYRTVTQETVSAITVIDALTGDTVADTQLDGAFAFFWSPDSRRIAYITIATPPGTFNVSNTSPNLARSLGQEDGLRWAVLDVTSNNVHTFGSFIPTQEMVYLLIYFTQFAQSHSIWSPDSSHIVFSEIQSQGRRLVSILDTTRADAVPFSIADGIIAIWSYR